MKYTEIVYIQYIHGTSRVGLVPSHLIALSEELCNYVKSQNPDCEIWGTVYQEFEDGYRVMIVGYYTPNPDQYADKSRQGPAWLNRRAYFEITD